MALTFVGLTIPAAAALNAVAQARPLSAAAARALVPLVYGQDRVNGLVLNVLVDASDSSMLLAQVLWCHACNSVGTPRLNDKALSASTTATHYTGSQVAADSAMVAAFAAQGITYSDTLNGYAYSVFKLPIREFDGQLAFSALIQGRKVYDPRQDSTAGGSGSQRLAVPSTWAYSANPSLALADWAYSSVYGAGEQVDWASVITAANANDALIGSPAETHRIIGLTLTSAAPVSAVREALRAYAGVWLLPSSAGVKLLPDAAASSVATYSHDSGHIASIDALTLRDLGNSPTVVEVVYTDTSHIPYREASAFASLPGAGTTLPWRLSTVRLPGIQRHSQAYREAVERLNKLTLSDLSTVLDVFDVGIGHEVGDVVTVSHPVGLVSKLFRITAPPEASAPGRWRLTLSEYDPAVYSTAVVTAPTYANAGTVADRPDQQRMFRVVARGYADTAGPVASGLYDAETGVALDSGGRSYMLVKLARATGAAVSAQRYDVYGNGATTSGRNAATLAADLNSTGSDQIVVVYTDDEPWSNRLTGGLPEAMYRCGASRAVFGSPQFRVRSAYILVGIGGCGEGNGAEVYNGSTDNDTNAWCDLGFYLSSGQLVVSGTSTPPRTLADHGYIGTLDATTDLSLVATGYAALAGNVASKALNNNAWGDAQVYSRDGYTGGAYASVVAMDATGGMMFGLNTDPTTDDSYSTIDHALYLAAGTLYAFESGSNVSPGGSPIGTYAVGDVLSVTFDGYTVNYLKNGAVVYTSTVHPAATARFFFDSSFYNTCAVRNVRFGPMSAVANIGHAQLSAGVLADLSAALSTAAAAQATADGKIDSFWQATAPGSASEGDLWFDTDDGLKQYRWTSGAWVVAADTRIGTAISAATTAQGAAVAAQATADGKVRTFIQTSPPTAEAVGDLWIDSDNGNRIARWSGAAWEDVPVGTGALAPNAATDVAAVTAAVDSNVFSVFGVTDEMHSSVSYTNTGSLPIVIEITTSAAISILVSNGFVGTVSALTFLSVVNNGVSDGPPASGLYDAFGLAERAGAGYRYGEVWWVTVVPGATVTADIRTRFVPTGSGGTVTTYAYNPTLRMACVKR